MEPYLNALTQTKYCPLWHDQDVRPEQCPPLSGDEKCELLIVGGGFTGLWAALQAKERMPDLDVVLIESTFVGDGASGRNGGMVAKALAHTETNTDYHFPDEADRIEELGQLNYQELVESLKRYDMDARFEEAGFLDVATREYQVEAFRKHYEEKAQKGVNLTWYDQDEIQKILKSPTYKAGVHLRDDHSGYEMAGGPNVRHGVDLPDGVPHLVRFIQTLSQADTCIRTKQIDRTNFRLGVLDKLDDVGFLADVNLLRCATDGFGYGRSAFAIQIGDDHVLGPVFRKAFTHRATDAARTTGNNDDLVLDFQRLPPTKLGNEH